MFDNYDEYYVVKFYVGSGMCLGVSLYWFVFDSASHRLDLYS